MIGVTILGSTGSIGVSTLDVLSRHPDRFRVVALTANTDVTRMTGQCQTFSPEYAVMVDPDAAKQLEKSLVSANCTTRVLSGADALERVAAMPEAEYVMAAIVGAAGLLPTLAAVKHGKRVLLANKESLVMTGRIFIDEVKNNNAVLLPIDSEHNAIFQSMSGDFVPGKLGHGVRKILLTASGGPFRTMPLDALSEVTPEQACAHPNWVMGRKISVDSATMMNKGLELIEACWLFGIPCEMVEVVLHPQSVIHSMVEYIDGSILAQLGSPDMRTPIAHALAWPERIESGVDRLDIVSVAQLDFEPPDYKRFPCLRLAYEAMEAGGTATAILNAANEVAVAAFLDNRITFLSIPDVVEKTLSQAHIVEAKSIETILEADSWARESALHLIN